MQQKPQRQQDTKDHKDFVLLSAFMPSWFNFLNNKDTKTQRSIFTPQMLFYKQLHLLKGNFLMARSPVHPPPVSM
jgi:hypothetical protein